MIISRTPFRISLFGGGTDYPDLIPPGGKIKVNPNVIASTTPKDCTVFVGALDETTNLGKWLRRQMLKGVALQPDRIIAQVGQHAGTEFEKTELDRLAEQAIEIANANDKAAIGTAVPTARAGTFAERRDAFSAPTWLSWCLPVAST